MHDLRQCVASAWKAEPQQIIAQSITLTPPHHPLSKVLPDAMSSTSTAKENVIYLTRLPSSIAPLVLLLLDTVSMGNLHGS